MMALFAASVTEVPIDKVQSVYCASCADGVMVKELSLIESESVVAAMVIVCAVFESFTSQVRLMFEVPEVVTVVVLMASLKVMMSGLVVLPERRVVLSEEVALMVLPFASARLETVGAVESGLAAPVLLLLDEEPHWVFMQAITITNNITLNIDFICSPEGS